MPDKVRRKKRLVYIMHALMTGGVEIAFLSAIEKLNSEYDLTVIVLGRIETKLLEGLDTQVVEKIISINIPTWQYPFKIKNIVDRVRLLNPDIVLCSLWRAAWVGTLLKKQLPDIRLVLFLHSTNFPHKAAFYFNRKAAKKADAVFVDSGSTQKFAVDVFRPKSEIHKISFITSLSPAVNVIHPFRKGELIKMVFLGRIAPVKNLPFTIKLIKILVNKGYNIQFDIYGRADEDYPNVVSTIKEAALENNVSYKGELVHSQVIECYQKYHFYIQLSHNEGMAMSVAEAMQVGLPCIVSPVGEIPNYSSDMESAIFIDTKNDFEDNAQKIEKVINNTELYKRISDACFQNFQKRLLYSESLCAELEKLH